MVLSESLQELVAFNILMHTLIFIYKNSAIIFLSKKVVSLSSIFSIFLQTTIFWPNHRTHNILYNDGLMGDGVEGEAPLQES